MKACGKCDQPIPGISGSFCEDCEAAMKDESCCCPGVTIAGVWFPMAVHPDCPLHGRNDKEPQ
jgi:hypothetical protein